MNQKDINFIIFILDNIRKGYKVHYNDGDKKRIEELIKEIRRNMMWNVS